MEDLVAVRAAVEAAIEDVYAAISAVHAAQQVEWVSVFQGRYRAELDLATHDLLEFRRHLDRLRTALA